MAANAVGSIAPSAKASSIRRLLTPSRSVTTVASLILASSNNDSSWLCRRTRSRINCCLLRVNVRHRRCSGSGTKLRINSPATWRRRSRSASSNHASGRGAPDSNMLAPTAAGSVLPIAAIRVSNTAPSIPLPLRNLTRCQPLLQRLQFACGCAEFAPLKLLLLFADVGHYHRQHLLVDVNGCYLVARHHGFSLRPAAHR